MEVRNGNGAEHYVPHERSHYLLTIYVRAITILHPEFNVRVGFKGFMDDEIYGTELEPTPKRRPKGYARSMGGR
jgi:hypothetical protein